jgi:hypothetical protein
MMSESSHVEGTGEQIYLIREQRTNETGLRLSRAETQEDALEQIEADVNGGGELSVVDVDGPVTADRLDELLDGWHNEHCSLW